MKKKFVFDEIDKNSPVIVDQGVQDRLSISKILIDADGVITAISNHEHNIQSAKVWSWEELISNHPYINETFLASEN